MEVTLLLSVHVILKGKIVLLPGLRNWRYALPTFACANSESPLAHIFILILVSGYFSPVAMVTTTSLQITPQAAG